MEIGIVLKLVKCELTIFFDMELPLILLETPELMRPPPYPSLGCSTVAKGRQLSNSKRICSVCSSHELSIMLFMTKDTYFDFEVMFACEKRRKRAGTAKFR